MAAVLAPGRRNFEAAHSRVSDLQHFVNTHPTMGARVSRSCNHAAGVLEAQLARTVCAGIPFCLSRWVSRALVHLRRAGAHGDASELFGALRPFLPWPSSWQSPPLQVRGVRSHAVWHEQLLADSGGSAARIAGILRETFPRIREDLGRVRAATWPAAYPRLLAIMDAPENWTSTRLFNGDDLPGPVLGVSYTERTFHPLVCKDWAPHTCAALAGELPGVRDPTLPYLQADQEQVQFLRLAPGSRGEFHTSASNARLTLHLCLAGCGGMSYLQVGPSMLRWREGEVLVFDDSFQHRFRIDQRGERWILHVMVTHPDLESREAVWRKVRSGDIFSDVAMLQLSGADGGSLR
uniref:Aspartyl/asparaginy/proline hydroxylase domain-containing protein n=1 Tax=Alexandrium monilatum TaxID=311494 RepID=A0A7S4V568_9DINO